MKIKICFFDGTFTIKVGDKEETHRLSKAMWKLLEWLCENGWSVEVLPASVILTLNQLIPCPQYLAVNQHINNLINSESGLKRNPKMTLEDAKKMSRLKFNRYFDVDSIKVKDKDGNLFNVEFYEEGIEVSRREKIGEDEDGEDIYKEEQENSPFYEYPKIIISDDEVEYQEEDYVSFEYILMYYLKHKKFPNP